MLMAGTAMRHVRRELSAIVPAPVVLTGTALTPAEVARVARDGAPVAIAPEAARRVAASARALDRAIATGQPIYGLTTGVGALETERVRGGASDERERQ